MEDVALAKPTVLSHRIALQVQHSPWNAHSYVTASC